MEADSTSGLFSSLGREEVLTEGQADGVLGTALLSEGGLGRPVSGAGFFSRACFDFTQAASKAMAV